jgi:hypothetical protein
MPEAEGRGIVKGVLSRESTEAAGLNRPGLRGAPA